MYSTARNKDGSRPERGEAAPRYAVGLRHLPSARVPVAGADSPTPRVPCGIAATRGSSSRGLHRCPETQMPLSDRQRQWR